MYYSRLKKAAIFLNVSRTFWPCVTGICILAALINYYMYQNISRITKSILFAAVAMIAITACDNKEKAKQPAAAETKPTIEAQPKPAAVDSGHLIGVWHDETIKSDKGEEIAYEVVSSGKKIYIQAITFTGTNLTVNDTPPISPSASEIKRVGDKYVGVASADEVYKVDKKGNLLIYDKDKLVAVCKKLL
jgi:hypothetical protein